MDVDSGQVDSIEACRTCGVYYMTSANYLRPLFQSAVESPETMLIRLELSQWKLELSENDGLPQYVCITCIHEFQRIFKFRSSCLETQQQLLAFYNMREQNLSNIKIKTEITDQPEEEACDFIYIDDISDEEYDNAASFNVPQVPIKEERIEEATVPPEIEEKVNGLTESSPMLDRSSTTLVDRQDTLRQSISATNSLNCVVSPMEEDIVECELCQHISPSMAEHKQHVHRVHENHTMECHICGKIFQNTTQSRFKFHLKWHNINKHVKCNLCGFVCSSRVGLSEHKRAMHTKIKCKVCGVGVLSRKMKSHLRTHSVLKEFTCDFCNEVFSSEQERVVHIWHHHTEVSDNDQESQRSDYSQSLSKHSSCENFMNLELVCAKCDAKFTNQVDLIDHVKQTHSNINRLSESSDSEESDEEEEAQATNIQNEDSSSSDEGRSTPQTSIMGNKDVPNDPQINSSTRLNGAEDDEVTVECFGEDLAMNGSQDNTQDCTGFDDPPKASDDNTNMSEASIDDEAQYTCAQCTATFASLSLLCTHYETHTRSEEADADETSDSNLKCHICNKLFDLKFRYNRHMKKHNK